MALLHCQNIPSLELFFMDFFFLKNGHTQNENENDSIHSVTERKIKGVSIYHPYQWIILIDGARKSKPYIEYPMCQEGFLHFQTDMNDKYNFLINKSTKDFSGHTTGTTIDGNNRKTKKTRWTEIRAAHLDKKVPFTMLYKYNFQVPWQAVDIGQEKVYVVGTPSLKEKGSRTFKGISH